MDVITVATLVLTAWITICCVVLTICSAAARADADDERFYARLS